MKIKQSNVGTIELLPGKTERIVFDDDLPGFGLRVRDGGSRVYVTQYKLGAKQRRITLGSTKELTLVQARSRAKDVLAKVHLGEDPAGAKSRPGQGRQIPSRPSLIVSCSTRRRNFVLPATIPPAST